MIIDPTRPPLAVAVVDVNDFKQANDSYGHPVGDAVLVNIARRFKAYAGENLIARLSGDEFVGLLAASSNDPAIVEQWHGRVTRRLSDIFAAPMNIAGRTVVATASIGLATVHANGADTDAAAAARITDAVRRADAAMYRMKTRYRVRGGADRSARVRGSTASNLPGPAIPGPSVPVPAVPVPAMPGPGPRY